MGDVADFHIVVDVEWNCHDIFSVEFLADHATANRVSVHADQEIKEGCAVADNDILFRFSRAQNFLGKVKRIVFALLVGEARIGCEIFQGNPFFFGKRAETADKNMGMGDKLSLSYKK